MDNAYIRSFSDTGRNYIERFLDNITVFLARVLVKYTNITANHISLFRLLICTIPGGVFLLFDDYWMRMVGLLLIFISAFLDMMDGKTARLRNEKTKLGEMLEDYGDSLSLIYLLGMYGLSTILSDIGNITTLLVSFYMVVTYFCLVEISFLSD